VISLLMSVATSDFCERFATISNFETSDIFVADYATSSLHGKGAAKDSEPPQNDLFDLW